MNGLILHKKENIELEDEEEFQSPFFTLFGILGRSTSLLLSEGSKHTRSHFGANTKTTI